MLTKNQKEISFDREINEVCGAPKKSSKVNSGSFNMSTIIMKPRLLPNAKRSQKRRKEIKKTLHQEIKKLN